MKISREKLLQINSVLNKLSEQKANVRFHYTVEKNKISMQPEIASIEEARSKQLDPKLEKVLNEFNLRRIEKCKELCEKDEEGKIIVLDETGTRLTEEEIEANVKPGKFSFKQENNIILNQFLEELSTTEEFKPYFDADKKREEELKELLEEEIEISLTKFKLNILPSELLGKDIEILFDLIEED